MTAVSNSKIVDTLRGALRELEIERDAQIEQLRATYQTRIDAIVQSIEAFEGNHIGTLARNAVALDRFADQAPLTVGAIGDDKLDAVRQYLCDNQRVRQADIGPALGMNSGSVSVAVRTLKTEGVVRPLGKEQGSRVWEWVQVVEPAQIPAIAGFVARG